MGRIKNLLQQVKELKDEQEALRKLFSQHIWEDEYPPQFKYGDVVKGNGSRNVIQLTIKSNGEVKEETNWMRRFTLSGGLIVHANSFKRVYLADTGNDVITIDESEFHKVKKNDSKVNHK